MAEIQRYHYDLFNLTQTDSKLFTQLGIVILGGKAFLKDTHQQLKTGDSFTTYEIDKEVVVAHSEEGSLLLFVSLAQEILEPDIKLVEEKIILPPDLSRYRLPTFTIQLFTKLGLHSFPEVYETQLKEIGIKNTNLSFAHNPGDDFVRVTVVSESDVTLVKAKNRRSERVSLGQEFIIRSGDLILINGFTFLTEYDEETGDFKLNHIDTHIM